MRQNCFAGEFGVGFLHGAYRPEEWLWIDSNGKNEN